MSFERIGNYEIVETIGTGTVGTIYRAVHEETTRSRTERDANPHGREARRVARQLAPLKTLAEDDKRGSVFTRDIDQGELTGLTYSKGLMSVNDRQLDRIGRVRKKADFNRGGGAGSYTRLVSNKRLDVAREASDDPDHYDPSADDSLAPLGVGSIGNAGITLAFDAGKVVDDVEHPLDVFHNDMDSAGRVFGRPRANGRHTGKRSERTLGKMNPSYHGRDEGDPVEDFHPGRAIRGARNGHQRLATIAEEPSGDTDHNEQVWMKPPSLDHVKGVFIQQQLDRPPALERKSAEELDRDHRRREKAEGRLATAKDDLKARRAGMDPREHVREKAKLMTRERKLQEPVPRSRLVDRSARLPVWPCGGCLAGAKVPAP